MIFDEPLPNNVTINPLSNLELTNLSSTFVNPL